VSANTADNVIADVAETVFGDDDPTLSVAEAARLLGRDRTRIYALLRSGDLVAAAAADDDGISGPLCIDRSSLERWLAATAVGRSVRAMPGQ
jgi:hypothetical protein